MQGVINYEGMNSQTVGKILFVQFQGVGSVNCQLFLSTKILEQTLFKTYSQNLCRVFNIFGCKSDLFQVWFLSDRLKIGFSWNVDQNLAGKPTERSVKCQFLAKIWKFCFSKSLHGGPKLRKYELAHNRRQKLLEEKRTTASYLAPQLKNICYSKVFARGVRDNFTKVIERFKT